MTTWRPVRDLIEDLWEAHEGQWKHCLRCKLSELRLHEDPDRRKRPSMVPLAGPCRSSLDPLGIPPRSAPLYILYSCPDVQQERASSLEGSRDATGRTVSSSHGVVEWSWEAMGNLMPFPLDEIAVGFALGCRPVSFTDPRKLMKAKGENIKACRARWQTEVLIVDPDLVLICGRHALACVRPDLGTKHSRYIGEVITFDVQTPHGPVTYEGFVTVSPEEVAANARDDHYEVHDWNVGPEHSHVDNPVRHWLWFLLFACWLAEAGRCVTDGITPPAPWASLTGELATFYRERTTVASLVERRSSLFTRAQQIAEDELAGRGARRLQTEDIPPEEPEEEPSV